MYSEIGHDNFDKITSLRKQKHKHVGVVSLNINSFRHKMHFIREVLLNTAVD